MHFAEFFEGHAGRIRMAGPIDHRHPTADGPRPTSEEHDGQKRHRPTNSTQAVNTAGLIADAVKSLCVEREKGKKGKRREERVSFGLHQPQDRSLVLSRFSHLPFPFPFLTLTSFR
jgi:hypothetical protein